MNDKDKTIDYVRDILIQATGCKMYSIEELSRIAADVIQGDRLTIKILGRSIESLTMQMKEITQVTFERDTYKEKMEAYKDGIEHFREENEALKEELAELRDRL